MRNDGLIVRWLIVCLLVGMCREKRVRYDHRGCACQAELIPKLIIRFERCLGSLVCVWRRRGLDMKRYRGAYPARRSLSTSTSFSSSGPVMIGLRDSFTLSFRQRL